MAITQGKLLEVFRLARKVIACYAAGEEALRATVEEFRVGRVSAEELADRLEAALALPSAALAEAVAELEKEELRVLRTVKRNDRDRAMRRWRKGDAVEAEPDDNAALHEAILGGGEAG